jgi:branched-chain amino acid transport system permease protein
MKRTTLFLLLFWAAVYALPLLLKGSYWMHVLVIIGIYVIAAIGVDLVVGFAGQISLCQASFFGIGAYISAILSNTYGFPPLLALLIGVVGTCAVALCVGLPVLRLRGYYLAIATLGFGLIVQSVFVTLQDITKGPDGFRGVVPFSIGSYVLRDVTGYYYLVWTLSILFIILTRNIISSRVGRALLALRGDDVAASSVGINITKYKTQAFVLSAAYASLAGSLYAHYNRFISPQVADLSNSIMMIIMAVLGGIRTIYGVVIGAMIMKSIPEVLESFLDYQMIITGIILVVLLLYMPRGLLGIADAILDRAWRRRVK